jgi:hypothetical protein
LGDGARAGLLRGHGLAMGKERDLLLSECFTCGQYGRECHPQAVRKTFVPKSPPRPAHDEPRRL